MNTWNDDAISTRGPAGARPLLSVVIPCHNEEEVLPELERRLVAACESSAPRSYELVFVNDGSSDRTSEMIALMASRNEAVTGVDLARNFGHQVALTAGLTFARGERVLTIDADLQDPPELLPAMMAAMDLGANVVYGRRTDRRGETKFKTGTAHLFYRILHGLSEIDIPVDTGDFRLMDRRALEALLSMPEQHRFVRGMVAWLGLVQAEVPYRREPRRAGRTKYPLRKMLSLAADAITGFSVAPLRLSFFLAFFFFLCAVGLAAYALASGGAARAAQSGLGMLILFLGFSSVQLACLGIVGEYLGRTHMQTKNRPLFVVKHVFSRGGRVGNDREENA